MKMKHFGLVLIALVALAVPSNGRGIHGGVSSGVVPPPPGSLTPMQVVNPSASSTTNMPFCVGVPFSTTAISSSQHIEVTDGGTPILADEVNRATDMSSAIRSESLCGVIPSANGSQMKNLVLTVASGAPATGTDITIADISAWLTANSLSVPVDFTKINGVAGTWSADLQTAIAAGNSGWVNKSTATVLGKYRSGGGIVTEYLIYSPVVKSGTPDGQLYATHDLRCFKAARAAVNSVTNPILGCKDEVIVGNSWLQASSPVNNWYGLSIGVGGSAVNLANTTPTQTITGISQTVTFTNGSICIISGTPEASLDGSRVSFQTTGALPTGITAGTVYYAFNSNPGTIALKANPNDAGYVACSGTPTGTNTLSGAFPGPQTLTASTALFSINDIGHLIHDGTGYGVIDAYTDTTHVKAKIFWPFNSASLTSGNYTIYGTNHSYGAMNHYTAILGAAQMPLVERGQVYLGDAWNPGASTGGPGTYVMGTSMMTNNSLSATNGMVTGSNTQTAAQIAATGTNPNGYGIGYVGPIVAGLEDSGERPDIGFDPDWNVAALVRYDSNAANIIFKAADYWATFPYQLRDQNTGLNGTPCNAGTVPTCSGTVNYVFDGRFGGGHGTVVNGPAVSITPWAPDAFAHDPAAYYLPALLSGDYFYILGQQGSAFYAPGVNNQDLTGINRTMLNDYLYCCGIQMRASAWGNLAIANSTVLTPDSNPVLGITKTVAKAWQTNIWGGTAKSAKELFLDQTGPGLLYSTDGAHYLAEDLAIYMMSYNSLAVGAMSERGALDANGNSYRDWLMQNSVDALTKTTKVNTAYLPRAISFPIYNSALNGATCGSKVLAKDWALLYRVFATNPQLGYVPHQYRAPAGTMTLSATSGTAVTASFSTGNYFGAGTAFYQGGWIQTTDGGSGRIVSVTDANHVVIDTTASVAYFHGDCGNTMNAAAFGSTTYVYNNQPGIADPNILIPAAAPGDPYGPEWPAYAASPGDDYLLLTQAVSVMAKDQGVTGGAAACTAAFALSGGSYSAWAKPIWWLRPRSSAC